MFEPMCIRPPWKNIDASAASQTDLSGTPRGASSPPTPQASGSPPRLPNVASSSGTVSGRPSVSSQGMAAFSTLKTKSSIDSRWGSCCHSTQAAMQATMSRSVAQGRLLVGFTSFSGSTARAYWGRPPLSSAAALP